ncbi:TrkH family potassium uptake protein [Candidatus Riesia pediculicola]|uniref:TrkH family potassium uptake protein n=1 Tax=Candidatus Riesia pediculicola TaxID=401619 RepID=UPI0009C37E55|nr:TrkH family potassium uptake protein [Candidatus Riesia pediculicola]ARC54406.1 potassium transporter [Candidatus Riesia pediculicola]
MDFKNIIRIIGLSFVMFSITMVIPGLVSLFYQDKTEHSFIHTFLVTLLVGLILWIPNKNRNRELSQKEGFLVISLFWVVLGSLGSLPFIFLDQPNISITDAFFESFSGLTTTGATNLIQLNNLPKSILFYRQMLQWLGGMGIIVLAIAIFPLFGISGGFQLYKAEISGPIKENKIHPRASKTAKTLWSIYILLTIICTILLWIAGMDFFDAISHSFSIISLGGFSTHDENIGYFKNIWINDIVSFFLLVSSCNFNLHFLVLSGKSLKIYWNDLEFKTFIFFQVLLVVVVLIVSLYHSSGNKSISTIIHQSFFQVISSSTTAGFSIDNIETLPLFLQMLLLFSTFIGGCSGSVGGGLKVIRILLLFFQVSTELKRLVHPNAIYTIKINYNDHRILSEKNIDTIWGFFSSYVLIFISSLLLLISTGVDEFSAFSSIVATLNNFGPALGDFSENFINMNFAGKWILIFTMLFGRLEIFTLLILFTPIFWKK